MSDARRRDDAEAVSSRGSRDNSNRTDDRRIADDEQYQSGRYHYERGHHQRSDASSRSVRGPYEHQPRGYQHRHTQCSNQRHREIYRPTDASDRPWKRSHHSAAGEYQVQAPSNRRTATDSHHGRRTAQHVTSIDTGAPSRQGSTSTTDRRRVYMAIIEMCHPEAFREAFPSSEWDSVTLDEALRRKRVDFVFVDGWSMFDRRLWRIHSTVKSRITATVLTNKVELHEKLCADEHAQDFVPTTLVIRAAGDAAAGLAASSAGSNRLALPDESVPWIFRGDERAGGGMGVVVVTSQQELQQTYNAHLAAAITPGSSKDALVSRYITNPLLCPVGDECFKFHLRIYLLVVIATGKPQMNRAALFREGEMALAETPYIAQDYRNRSSHDTHLRHGKVSFPHDYPGGTESASTIFGKLVSMFRRIVSLTLPTIQGYEECEVGYQVLGCDVLVDADERPWLLEINQSPGLTDDPPGRQRRVSSLLLNGVKEFVFEWSPGRKFEHLVPLESNMQEDCLATAEDMFKA